MVLNTSYVSTSQGFKDDLDSSGEKKTTCPNGFERGYVVILILGWAKPAAVFWVLRNSIEAELLTRAAAAPTGRCRVNAGAGLLAIPATRQGFSWPCFPIGARPRGPMRNGQAMFHGRRH